MPPKPAEIWGVFHCNDDKPNGSHHRATHWRCINSERPANAPIATRSLTRVLRRVLGMITAVNTVLIRGAPLIRPLITTLLVPWSRVALLAVLRRGVPGERGGGLEDLFRGVCGAGVDIEDAKQKYK
ncbi:hypothetical protein C8J57DRAFT_1236729 [Mycena rebaudengoi]|nr:hypothetical protein C8J57DRAFT_1236729 [Mycena rebaudengoi]